MDELLAEFIAETRETLEALAGEIVAWEADPGDRAHLDAIFRFVHTVKGSCGFLDLPRLARLSHAAEDVLADVREGKRHPDQSLVNAVLAVVDRIGEIVEAIDAGNGLDDSGEELLIAALSEGAAEQLAPQSTVPSAKDKTGVQVATRVATRSVRLNVDLLDRMMSGMSDMVLARNELARRLRGIELDPTIEASIERLSATVAEMRDTVTRTRMQKVDGLFGSLPRLVRDTAATCGKSVTLYIEGSDVELDREMIEVMRDPLVHIIRNSIDHGIETPAERRKAGKRENGRLTVAARQAGNQIVIDIMDDGRGIDVDRLIKKMVTQAGADEAALRRLSPKAKLDLIFEPGLTTKSEATEISGRGVGMDVVRSSIEQIGGRIELSNTPGRGLNVSIHVPLTLSIIPTIVVGAGSQRFAIPRQAIEEIVNTHGEAIRIDPLGGIQVATVRGRRLPLVDLNKLLDQPQAVQAKDRKLVVLSFGQGSYAIAVDRVLDTEELVIKPAAPAIMSIGLFAGQTLPDNGVPMLMLDCSGIAQSQNIGIIRDAIEAEEDEGTVVEEKGYAALLFDDLDGVRRAVPMAAVERVERVDGATIRMGAGRLRWSVDNAILPLASAVEIKRSRTVTVLRLRDGPHEMGYAVDESVDIVRITDELKPAANPGPVAGVTLVDGDLVEVLDLFWLFRTHVEAADPGDRRPICVVEGAESDWAGMFLKPMIEATGYRVVAALGPGERATAVIRMTGDGEVQAVSDSASTVFNLERDISRAEPNSGRFYRYDREGLVDALRARLAGAKHG